MRTTKEQLVLTLSDAELQGMIAKVGAESLTAFKFPAGPSLLPLTVGLTVE